MRQRHAVRRFNVAGAVVDVDRGPWSTVIPPRRLLVADGFRPLGIHCDGWSPRRWGSRGRNQGGGDGAPSSGFGVGASTEWRRRERADAWGSRPRRATTSEQRSAALAERGWPSGAWRQRSREDIGAAGRLRPARPPGVRPRARGCDVEASTYCGNRCRRRCLSGTRRPSKVPGRDLIAETRASRSRIPSALPHRHIGRRKASRTRRGGRGRRGRRRRCPSGSGSGAAAGPARKGRNSRPRASPASVRRPTSARRPRDDRGEGVPTGGPPTPAAGPAACSGRRPDRDRRPRADGDGGTAPSRGRRSARARPAGRPDRPGVGRARRQRSASSRPAHPRPPQPGRTRPEEPARQGPATRAAESERGRRPSAAREEPGWAGTFRPEDLDGRKARPRSEAAEGGRSGQPAGPAGPEG